jgi:Uma2 family endonuclease
MVIQTKRYTVEEFDEFVNLPENTDNLFEYVGGEILELPSNPYSAKISIRIASRLLLFVDEHDLGHVTGEQGGYQVSGERYAPDVAYISKERQPQIAEAGYNPNPPDLAVEVISPSDEPDKLRIKVGNYLAADTWVWVVDPKAKTVEVYVPGQPVTPLTVDDTLDGGDILPGFKLPLKDIFPD